MLLDDGPDCGNEVPGIFRVALHDLSIGRDQTARDIVNILERALELCFEIEADSAGRHCRLIEADSKPGALHTQ